MTANGTGLFFTTENAPSIDSVTIHSNMSTVFSHIVQKHLSQKVMWLTAL